MPIPVEADPVEADSGVGWSDPQCSAKPSWTGSMISDFSCGQFDNLNLNPGETLINNVQIARCLSGEVDDTAFLERTSIVNGDDDATTGIHAGHFYLGAKGQRAVGRRIGVLVKSIAVGRSSPLEAVVVKRSETHFGVAYGDICGDHCRGDK